MTPMTANLLVRVLEANDVPSADCAVPPSLGVVLAGGVEKMPLSSEDFGALTISSRRRVERAVQWWRASPGRALVFSGGRADSDVATPEARLMRVYARQLGVPDAVIRSEETSLDTWGNARNLARMQPSLPERVSLITSALHMRRARYAMAKAGFSTCAIPADSRIVDLDWPGAMLPQSQSAGKTEDAIHEVAGLLYYRLLALRDAR